MIEKLSGFAGRTETDSFKILIVGEFKNGKSTFINALLGERVLPQDVLPCTAVISEVVYGEEKGAVIHFENPLPEVISKHLHEKINAQIAQHKDDPEGVPPIEMTFEELGHVVTIPEKELLGEDSANEPEDFSPNPEDETEAGKEAIGKIPLSHAEIRFPLEILKDGVEIIDTPGLNEDKSREEVTRNYLKNADAIVFLFRYPKYLSMNDYASIMMLKRVHEGIFFVINAVDMAENPVHLARVKKSALAKLVNLTSLKAGGVFFTSALKTLEMLESQPAKKSEPEITKPSEPEAEPELLAEPVMKKVNLVKNLPELAVKSPTEQGISGMKDFESALSKYLKENRAAAELAKFSESRKKYYEEAERLKAEQKKYAEEVSRLTSEVQRLNDKTSRLDEQCSSLEEEISSMVEENRKHDEENRLRFSEAREIIYETAELKQKITDRINRSRDELYSSIRDSMLSCYESILWEAPSFVNNKKYYNEIGIWDSIFEGDDAKKKLAAEIIESLKEFFDDGISRWTNSSLKSILNDFRSSLRKEIEPHVTSFYRNIDKCSEKLKAINANTNANSDALSRLDSAAASASYGGTGYSTPFLVGSEGAFSETILGDIITDIFGTTIFADILKIGDVLLSMAINLLMFWQLGDKATNAQKKAVSEGFVDQMMQQRSIVCHKVASEISNGVQKNLESISYGLSEEINKQKQAVKISESGESEKARLAEADVRKKTLELTQLRKKRDDARREEDAKRAEAEVNTENLKKASETTRTASQKAQEVMKQSDTSRQAITEAERRKHEMEIEIAKTQGQASAQAKTTDNAEQLAKNAADKEAEEKKKFDEQEFALREQEEKANAEFKALQDDMNAKITALREILEITALRKEELEKCL